MSRVAYVVTFIDSNGVPCTAVFTSDLQDRNRQTFKGKIPLADGGTFTIELEVIPTIGIECQR